ncbi:hypothetical protein IWW36_005391 [Coemansia brasiliensis]|uniref:Uncharacterized protein n=1 Tax=Coemansia brasiliensis TaxID=2650707 RepID=A0A9W8I3T2_9FUNG|nr:hypothetical protein IWW36_005391 [Coemansia brasiliensis]
MGAEHLARAQQQRLGGQQQQHYQRGGQRMAAEAAGGQRGYGARGNAHAHVGARNGQQRGGRHNHGAADSSTATSWRSGTGRHVESTAQPAWMDDGAVYDESQSAQQMRDMEEWKQRMHSTAPAADGPAVRESRFLRLFSAADEPQPVQAEAPIVAAPEAENSDQLTKLLKVFGDKINVSATQQQQQQTQPHEQQQQQQQQHFGQHMQQPYEQTSSADQGAKWATSSPAPINEALRGIVPTSVFRKSVQSGLRRPDSSSSSRSATPARNLPSWLVELSRSSAPAEAPSGLGTGDLVDTLEREFPALGLEPRHSDVHSVSSLSVQASGGAPSEYGTVPARRDSRGSDQPNEQPGALPAQAVPQMMVPEGPMIPGMVGPAMGPLGMMPLGFPPGMLYGMMPPHAPMYGAMGPGDHMMPPYGQLGAVPPQGMPPHSLAGMYAGMPPPPAAEVPQPFPPSQPPQQRE